MLEWNADIEAVLRAIYNIANEPDFRRAESTEINARLGREPGDERTSRALIELSDQGYVRCARLDTFGERMVGPIEGLTEKALQRVGNWPGGPVDAQQFLALLEALIEQEPDEERRGWLTTMRDGFANVPVNVATGVLTATWPGTASRCRNRSLEPEQLLLLWRPLVLLDLGRLLEGAGDVRLGKGHRLPVADRATITWRA
jgi:hypothetical protein